MKCTLIFTLILALAGHTFAQQASPDELQLYDLINAYRAEKGLEAIPLSPSLTLVAQTHSKDLAVNNPHKKQYCNLHSWSGNGSWKSCCYPNDHSNAECMWYKPRELTSYQGHGFEIAYYHSAQATPEEALDSWKRSAGHKAVLINEGTFKKAQWNAVGVGIYENYATVWFGREPDPAGSSDRSE
jgi:uncharacterized protein YkwD